ncbi:hypothetical protein TNCV_1954501 [Trichonephila clavipes]|nr:hypothetical protein TNCV_1954501 [Trichonephila clavipes]
MIRRQQVRDHIHQATTASDTKARAHNRPATSSLLRSVTPRLELMIRRQQVRDHIHQATTASDTKARAHNRPATSS